jgi:four helix bundle protein
MAEPIFDHEKLVVYRVAIDYISASYVVAKSLAGANRHVRDQWLRASQSIALNIAEGNGKQSLKEKGRFFEIARGSALECAAIHDILAAFAVVDPTLNEQSKAELKRIVSMLTKLIGRSGRTPDGGAEYERD